MLAQKIQQYSTVPDPSCAVCSVMDLTTEGHWFDPGSANFFQRTDDSLWNKIHISLSTEHYISDS